MSKPFSNPFFEADMSKLCDMSKMSEMFRMPPMDMGSLYEIQRRNVETCTIVTQAAYDHMQSLWHRQSEGWRQMMEECSRSMSSLSSAGSPEEKVMRSAEVSKAALEKCLASLRDIAETMARCNTQTMETVSSRVNKGMDEWQGILKNNRAA